MILQESGTRCVTEQQALASTTSYGGCAPSGPGAPTGTSRTPGWPPGTSASSVPSGKIRWVFGHRTTGRWLPGPPVLYRLTWENLTAKPWVTTDKSPRVSLPPAARSYGTCCPIVSEPNLALPCAMGRASVISVRRLRVARLQMALQSPSASGRPARNGGFLHERLPSRPDSLSSSRTFRCPSTGVYG